MNEKRDLVRSEARFFKSYLGRVRVHSTSFQSKSCGKRSSIQIYTHKKKKEIIILSFRLIMKNFIALYFYTLFIAQRVLLNIKFKNKLNLDFFSMRDFSDYDVILIVRKSLHYLD